jgi:hypothetical protein
VAPRIAAASALAPSRRYCSAKVASRIAFATATPIAMIAPINDCTFRVLLVTAGPWSVMRGCLRRADRRAGLALSTRLVGGSIADVV